MIAEETTQPDVASQQAWTREGETVFNVQQFSPPQNFEVLRVVFPNFSALLAGAVALVDMEAPVLLTRLQAEEGLAAGYFVLGCNILTGGLQLLDASYCIQLELAAARFAGVPPPFLAPAICPLSALSVGLQLDLCSSQPEALTVPVFEAPERVHHELSSTDVSGKASTPLRPLFRVQDECRKPRGARKLGGSRPLKLTCLWNSCSRLAGGSKSASASPKVTDFSVPAKRRDIPKREDLTLPSGEANLQRRSQEGSTRRFEGRFPKLQGVQKIAEQGYGDDVIAEAFRRLPKFRKKLFLGKKREWRHK